MTSKRTTRGGGRSSKDDQKSSGVTSNPVPDQHQPNSPASTGEEEGTNSPLPTGNKEVVDTDTYTSFHAGKTLLETVASHKHKSDTIFVARQTQAQHIFVEMILARTLVISNLSLSEEEMEIELQKFEYLDLFCIINKEDITESYPIADINPRNDNF